jgi:hypothetical protein
MGHGAEFQRIFGEWRSPAGERHATVVKNTALKILSSSF